MSHAADNTDFQGLSKTMKIGSMSRKLWVFVIWLEMVVTTFWNYYPQSGFLPLINADRSRLEYTHPHGRYELAEWLIYCGSNDRVWITTGRMHILQSFATDNCAFRIFHCAQYRVEPQNPTVSFIINEAFLWSTVCQSKKRESSSAIHITSMGYRLLLTRWLV